MIKTQIYMDEDILQTLKLEAQRTSQSYSQLIREAVRTYLQSLKTKQKREKKSWVSESLKHAKPLGNISESVDEILYS
jgi:metal-responsive CopG/Arc/MetJ family transcriptional regulator